MELHWSIEGEKQLAQKLEKIGKEIKDWQPAFREASDRLKNIFSNDVFSSNGGVLGQSWAPLKPQYLAQKLKAGYPADTLVRTGLMKSNFYSNVYRDYAEIGNNTEYFKYHQSKLPRSKMPRRVMMKLSTPQSEMVVKIFHNYWYKKVNNK